MRRIALAVGLVLSVALGAVPAEAKRIGTSVRHYSITQAEGSVRVNFAGDEAAGCRSRGVCTISGSTTYRFGGEPRGGTVFWLRQRKRTVAFHGFFQTRAETASDVVSAGSDEHCVDRAEHELDTLSFEPRSRTVRFTWRDLVPPEEGIVFGEDSVDVFDTRCAGPALEDLAISRALPAADVSYRVFRSPKGSFHTTGVRPFAGGGFAGTVEWDLRYAFRFRSSRARGWAAVPIG
jgi:hypothetical protein